MIKKLLENTEVGQVIPSITGVITSVSERKQNKAKNNVQSIVIEDAEGSVRILLKDYGKLFTDDHLSKEIELSSYESVKGQMLGLTLKSKAEPEELYILATSHAVLSFVQEDKKEDKPIKVKPPEQFVLPLKEEPMEVQQEEYPSDKKIRRHFNERNYIYHFIKNLNDEADAKYPEDKLAELTTSIYIDLSREGCQILPKAEKPKMLEKPKEDKTSVAPADWRKAPHFSPEAKGKLLGSYTKEDIIEKFARMYFRIAHRIPEFDEPKKTFFSCVALALKEFKYTIANACADYLLELNPNLKNENVALQRLSRYFESLGIDDVKNSRLAEFLSSKTEPELVATNSFE